jgi:predicted membrane chloride channel (bestrophin family)
VHMILTLHGLHTQARTPQQHALNDACRKLNETPFPFPWSQAITFLLLIFSLSAPIMIASFTKYAVVSALSTFAAVHTFFMVHEVARDIEDPFHYDPNQLPLPQMQFKLNERLLAVTNTKRPNAFTDVDYIVGPMNVPPAALPGVRPPFIWGFSACCKSLKA